jgi:hypothetical protein
VATIWTGKASSRNIFPAASLIAGQAEPVPATVQFVQRWPDVYPLGALHEAASLMKLSATAKPGSGVLSAGARLGPTPPATIRAVQHSVVKLAGFGAAIIVGAVLLALAFWLRARRRRAGADPDTLAAATGPPPPGEVATPSELA